MKLYVKSLLFIMVISLLVASVFAIGASATEGDAAVELPAGSYTAPEGSWAPPEGSNITYAVWKSEADFLQGKEPIASFTDTAFLTANMRTSGARYMHLFQDLYTPVITNQTPGFENASSDDLKKENAKYKIDPPSACDYKLNLGGKTLKTEVDLQVSHNYETNFTVCNGTFDTAHQIKCSNKNTLVFENVHIKNSNGTFGYGLCGNIIKYKDCYIELYSSGSYIYLASSDNSVERAYLIFENTDIVTSGDGAISTGVGLLHFIEQTDADTKWDIVFDKDSSIDAKIPLYANLVENLGTDKDGSLQHFKKTQRIMFEEGFRFGAYAVPTFTYNITPADLVNEVMLPKETRPANDNVCKMMIVKPGTYEEVTTELYAAYGEDGFYTMVAEKPTENVAWYCQPKGSNIISCIAPSYVDGVDTPIITLEDFQSFAEGTTITFNQDITSYFAPEASNLNIKDFKSNLTFDLGGHTFYNNYRIVTSGVYDKAYPTHWLTFKNGTLVADSPKDYFFYGWPCEDGGVVLEDLDINFNGGIFLASYNGNFTIKNCTANVNNTFLSLDKDQGYTLDMQGCTVNAGKKILTYYVSAASDRSYVKISDCNFTASDMIFELQNFSTFPSNNFKLEVADSYLKAPYFVRGTATKLPLTIELNNVFTSFNLDNIAADTNKVYTLAAANGQKLTQVNYGDYKYHVTRVEAPMRANLTLKSDFTVNFYIPTEGNIKSITVGGVAYNKSDLTVTKNIPNYGLCYVLPLTTVTPDVAADEINYTIVFEKDGLDHTANVAYSIIDYVRAVLNTDVIEVAKQMTVSAMEYVNAAYALAGNTSNELDELRTDAVYSSMIPETVAPVATGNEIGALSAAVTSAQLDLGATMRIRFNLNSAYNGTLTIGTSSFEVLSGKVGELSYVELNLTASALYDTVFTVTATGIDGVGTYTLADYAASIKASEEYTDAQKNLVEKFYSYCAYASSYNALYN